MLCKTKKDALLCNTHMSLAKNCGGGGILAENEGWRFKKISIFVSVLSKSQRYQKSTSKISEIIS